MAFNLHSAFASLAGVHNRHSYHQGHHQHGQAHNRAQQASPVKAADDVAAPAEVSDSSGIVLGERQSAETTAKNILNHVLQSVESQRAAGATQEQVDARIAAAREGIAAGYADARETLDGMGLLDDGLATEIDRGEALVNEGLDQIAAGEVPTVLSTPVEEPVADAAEDDSTPAVQPVFAASAQRSRSSLSLEVVTQDGDRVTVDFSQKQGSLSFSAGGYSVNASAFSEKWEMSVEGSLDEGEMEALSQLFSDVQALSEKFFAGDLGAALEEAMDMGFDGTELASMSLDLRQRSFSSVSRAYAPAQAQMPTVALEEKRSYLADYVDSFISALEKARPLAEPRETLKDLLEKLAPDNSDISALSKFTDGLNRLI